MALWLLRGGTEAKPSIFVAKLSKCCHSFARNKDSSEAEKHGSEAVRLSKLHDEKPCCKFMPLTFPSRRSTSGKLRSAPRGGGDKDAADWISEVVKDPLVEIDPITMARHLAASEGGSSSFVSASQQPLTFFFRSTGPGGFPGYVVALGAAVVLVILATAVHLFRIRKQAEENVAHYESSSDEEGKLDLLSIMENEEKVELASVKRASSVESRKNFQSQENDEIENFRRGQQSLENINVNGNEQRNEQKQVSPETLVGGAAQKSPGNTFGNDEKTLEQVSAEVDGIADPHKRLKNNEESFGRGQENLTDKVSYELDTAAGQQYDYKNNQEKLGSRKDDLQKQIALEAAQQDVLENSQETFDSGVRNIKNYQKRLEQVSADPQVDSAEQEVFEIDDQESKQGTLKNNHQPLNRQEQVSPDPQVVTEQEVFENDDQESKQGTLKSNHQHPDMRGHVSPEVVYAAAVAALVQSDEFQLAFRKTRQSRAETLHERPLPLPPSRSKDVLLETAESLNVEGMTLEELMLEEQSIAELDKPDVKTLPDSLTLRKQEAAEPSGEPGNAEEDVIENAVRNAYTVQDQDNAKLFKLNQDNIIDETPQDLTAPFKNIEDMDAEYLSVQEEEALRRQIEFRRKLETLCLAAFVFVFSGVPGTELDPAEDGNTYDPDTRRKIVQAALPAVAVGAGALSVITGVEGAFEMVGFTATAGFIYYELLYADSRKDLWQDLGKVKDHRKLVEFLKSKNIVG